MTMYMFADITMLATIYANMFHNNSRCRLVRHSNATSKTIPAIDLYIATGLK